MTPPPDEADDPPPERPYLAMGGHDGDAGPDGTGVSSLRPYLLTSGRVEPVDQTLEIEAQVVTSDLGAVSYGQLAFEHRDIVALCSSSMSIAEVAARLRMHIGVARVLGIPRRPPSQPPPHPGPEPHRESDPWTRSHPLNRSPVHGRRYRSR
jgi:hypothetical protein